MAREAGNVYSSKWQLMHVNTCVLFKCNASAAHCSPNVHLFGQHHQLPGDYASMNAHVSCKYNVWIEEKKSVLEYFFLTDQLESFFAGCWKEEEEEEEVNMAAEKK